MKRPLLKRSKFRKKMKQYFFRIKFKKYEKWRWLLKIILSTKYLGKHTKILSIFYIIHILNSSSITKQKNVCLKSSWYRSVQPFIKLHRLKFIDISSKLYIPGITIAKW